MTRSLPALIFDLDGLMLDTEWIGEITWEYAGRDLGLVVPHEVVMHMVGRNMPSIRALLEEQMPPETDIATLVERADYYYHSLLDEKPPAHRPGLLPMLEFAVEHGFDRAVATSSKRVQVDKKMRDAEIAGFFTHSVCGDEIVHGKPAPDVFLAAAAKLNRDPGDCIVFEDSGPGIMGARAAGMQGILIPDRHAPTEEARRAATHLFTSLDDARNWLAKTFL